MSVDYTFDYYVGEEKLPHLVRYIIAFFSVSLPFWILFICYLLGKIDKYSCNKIYRYKYKQNLLDEY